MLFSIHVECFLVYVGFGGFLGLNYVKGNFNSSVVLPKERQTSISKKYESTILLKVFHTEKNFY